jgi:hypothetical protein
MKDEIVVTVHEDGTVEMDARGRFSEAEPCPLTQALREALGGEALLDRKKPELLRTLRREKEVRRARQ